MKTRNDELQDLFFAVKKHLLSCGRNLSTSMMIASIEDIQAMRDVFLA